MKTHLRDNYFAQGFDTIIERSKSVANHILRNEKIIYSGKTSEIPE